MAKGKLIGCHVAEFQRLRNFHNHEILSIASFRAFHCAALRASVVDTEVRLLITLGKAHQSLIIFQVFPSNKATFPSTDELGHITSPLHSPSAQSDTVNTVVSQSVSVIVIVCTFQEVVSVIVDIQFPVAHVGHCGH